MTQWIKCSDKLPEDDDEILCFYENYVWFCKFTCTYRKSKKYNCLFSSDNEYLCASDKEVKYWMPLPENPEEDQNELD